MSAQKALLRVAESPRVPLRLLDPLPWDLNREDRENGLACTYWKDNMTHNETKNQSIGNISTVAEFT